MRKFRISELKSIYEKSAGAVVYTVSDGKIKYLLTPLILALLFFLTSCTTGNTKYKTVILNHSEIYDKSIAFNIPDEWSYIEILNIKERILFILLDSNYSCVSSGLMTTQDVSSKQPLIELVTTNKDDKNIEVNEDVFCSFSKNKDMPFLVYVRVGDKLLIISFKNNLGKETVKNIAESITFNDIFI